MDMIQLSLKGRVQHIILVSSESDFTPAIKFVKEEVVKVHLKTPSFSRCFALHEMSRKFLLSCCLSGKYLLSVSLL
jgi:uncharacterized LabA/DUF88 family protein